MSATITTKEKSMDTDRSRDRLEVYADKDGHWRWRRLAANNKIIAVSGEGYVNREHAVTMAQDINTSVDDLTFTTEEQ